MQCRNPTEETFLFILILQTTNSSTFLCGSNVRARTPQICNTWIATIFSPDTVKVAHSVEVYTGSTKQSGQPTDRLTETSRLASQIWGLKSDKHHLHLKYMRFLGRTGTSEQTSGLKESDLLAHKRSEEPCSVLWVSVCVCVCCSETRVGRQVWTVQAESEVGYPRCSEYPAVRKRKQEEDWKQMNVERKIMCAGI